MKKSIVFQNYLLFLIKIVYNMYFNEYNHCGIIIMYHCLQGMLKKIYNIYVEKKQDV